MLMWSTKESLVGRKERVDLLLYSALIRSIQMRRMPYSALSPHSIMILGY
jgi:hypothetical protein